MLTFNSSEPYDVLPGNGARLQQFTIKPNEMAHLVLTAPPKAKPCFSVYRIAGKVSECLSAAGRCNNCNDEVVSLITTVTLQEPHTILRIPGTYYVHTPEAKWMDDPCHPVILEAIIAQA